jgi:hypothetical protein
VIREAKQAINQLAKDLAKANKPAKKTPVKKPAFIINKAKKSALTVLIRQKLLAQARLVAKKHREEVIYVPPKQVVILVIVAASRGGRAIMLP